jgi:DNA-binding MarR family transcriptional regulator
MERKPAPSDADYRRLLEFRTNLRRFLHWSEEQAHDAGLTPAQHQLLLAIRGHEDDRGPTIRDVADALMLRHHSAVGLVDRAVDAGLVTRRVDRDDHRVVRLRLTSAGARKLRQLSQVHLEELRRLAPSIRGLA